MNLEILIPGIKFIDKYKLTKQELKVLIPFFEKPNSNPELSNLLGIHKKTLHNLMQRLRFKNLLVLKERDSKGTNIYQLNSSQLEK